MLPEFRLAMPVPEITALEAVAQSGRTAASDAAALMTLEEAARLLGMAPRTLENLPGFPIIRLSRKTIRVRRSDLEQFLRDRTALRTGDRPPGAPKLKPAASSR